MFPLEPRKIKCARCKTTMYPMYGVGTSLHVHCTMCGAFIGLLEEIEDKDWVHEEE